MKELTRNPSKRLKETDMIWQNNSHYVTASRNLVDLLQVENESYFR